MHQADLPWCALEDANNYVPSQSYWKFLVFSARSQRIPDLGFRVGEKFGADCADPHMTELLMEALTLYQGITRASEVVNRTVTDCQFGILQPPNCDNTYFYHSPSCDAGNPAIEQIGWFGINVLIGMVRLYTGPQWRPAEIGLMTDQIPSLYIRETFPRTRMRLSQPFSYIRLENTLLPLPPLADQTATPTSLPLDFKPLPADFMSSFETILLSYIEENDLNIELAAGLCNMSKRSLQRKLKTQGTHYNELLLRARFRAASRMLQDPAITATEVASRLGYSNEANFSRAFQQIAGVSPGIYRQQFTD